MQPSEQSQERQKYWQEQQSEQPQEYVSERASQSSSVGNASLHDASEQNASVQKKKNVSEENIKKAKLLQAVGIVLAVGGVALAGRAIGNILSIGWYGMMFKSVLDAAGMLGGGAVLHASGTAIKKREQRFKQYLAVIGNRKIVNISDLSKVAGATHRRIYADLEKMMELGMLPSSAYIDRGRDYLVLDPDALEKEQREETFKKRIAAVYSGVHGGRKVTIMKQSGEALTDDEKTLQEIRKLNDAIADDVMSAKIDKIENITRAIFALLQKNPERRQEVRSFFSYYLPTTLKLLRFYAQLEDQPIQGETILASRQNIESIMDTLVRGFEAQLDSLFRTDALDISSDIRVLETMLAQDGIDNSEQQDAIARITRMMPREPRYTAEKELTASAPNLR